MLTAKAGPGKAKSGGSTFCGRHYKMACRNSCSGVCPSVATNGLFSDWPALIQRIVSDVSLKLQIATLRVRKLEPWSVLGTW